MPIMKIILRLCSRINVLPQIARLDEALDSRDLSIRRSPSGCLNEVNFYQVNDVCRLFEYWILFAPWYVTWSMYIHIYMHLTA